MQERTALGEWLQDFTWDHFITLTTKEPYAGTKGFESWVRAKERALRGRGVAKPLVTYAVFYEVTMPGWWHVHALTGGTGALSTREMRANWEGFTQAERFDPARGAAYYVTKSYGTGKLAHWDVRLSK